MSSLSASIRDLVFNPPAVVSLASADNLRRIAFSAIIYLIFRGIDKDSDQKLRQNDLKGA